MAAIMCRRVSFSAFVLLAGVLSAAVFLAGCSGSGSGGGNNGGSPAPAITGLSPASGAVGTTVTITGSNFGTAQGSSTVTFNGTSAGTASAWGATSITVAVPSGATTGNVVVTVGGQASNAVSFTVTVPAPSIASLSPTSGPIGTPVTITGSNFGASQGSSTVTFNGTSAGTASAWSATSITVAVPSGASTGNVVVTVGGQASNAVSFTVTVPAPSIASLSPTSGAVGTTVTIAGSNFGASQGSSTVTFNGVSAGTASAWSGTSITVAVPSGATTGNVVVTVGGQASNGLMFTVAASSGNTVTGTAALGAPIADGAVTLVDANGMMSTGTTGADGTFSLNTGGLQPPFLVKVVTAATVGNFPAGTVLYSVSADGNATTHINVHLLSDLMVRSWYGVQGIDVSDAFSNPAVANHMAPNPTGVGILANTAIQAMQLWLNRAGVTATSGTPLNGSINLITSEFTANNTGLDSVLAAITEETLNSGTGVPTAITVAGGTVTETISPNYTDGIITFNTVTSDSSSGSATTGSISTVAPTSALTSALTGINTSLTTFQNTVNSDSSTLTASDLLPFYNSDYLNDGETAAMDAAATASNLAGVTITNTEIVGIKSLDTTKEIADLELAQTLSAGSLTEVALSETVLRNEGSGWMLYGDQRIAQISATAQARSSQGAPSIGTGVTHGTYIFAGVEAPQGVVTGATVSGGGNIWNGAASGSLSHEASIYQNGQTLDSFLLLSNSLGTNVSQLPAPGTPFTLDLTTASSGSPQYVALSNSFTTEFVKFSGISNTTGSGPLSSVVGKTLTFNWSLPTTFAISGVDLYAYISDGSGNTPSTHSCSVSASDVVWNSTTGTIAIPANMAICGQSSSDPITQVSVFLEVTGVDGEDAIDDLSYPY